MSLIDENLLFRELDLETRFLGLDLTEMCYSAHESRHPVLISTAGQALAKRKQALAAWRAEMIRVAMDGNRNSDAFMAKVSPELKDSIAAGGVKLGEFNRLWCEHV